MVNKIEMSLDDIIKTNRSQAPRQRGFASARGARRGVYQRGRGARNSAAPATFRGGVLKRGARNDIQKTHYTRDNADVWKQDLYGGPKRPVAFAPSPNTPVKLMISNLDYGVTESDIRELFADFGVLRRASVHYDRSGRSLGTADVTFERRADAVKAMKQYNGVPLDGRPMNIQFTTSDVLTLVNPIRYTGKTPLVPGRTTYLRGSSIRGKGIRRGVFRTTGPLRRNRGPGATAEELDAELDAYVNVHTK